MRNVIAEKRVKFDFEIDFANGGGIQGQDFRLDIEGEDISDPALSDFIVKDLRLLMVRDVRIFNKEIICEPHFRAARRSEPYHRGRHDHLQGASRSLDL